MANVEVRGTPGLEPRGEEKTKQIAEGGTFAEGLAGVGVVILAILALAGVMPIAFTAIATIAMGAALLFEGAAVAARLYKVSEAAGETPETTGGVSAEGIAGIAGIVLGILALVRVSPLLLLPVAAIVLGVGLILSSAATARVHALSLGGRAPGDLGERAARESVYAASGAHAFVGLAAVVLGIISLVDPRSALVLTEVSMLGLGAAILLSGAALGGKLMQALHH